MPDPSRRQTLVLATVVGVLLLVVAIGAAYRGVVRYRAMEERDALRDELFVRRDLWKRGLDRITEILAEAEPEIGNPPTSSSEFQSELSVSTTRVARQQTAHEARKLRDALNAQMTAETARIERRLRELDAMLD